MKITGNIRFKSIEYKWFNVEWGDKVRIVPKPDGFISLLHGTSSGIHPLQVEPYQTHRRYSISVDPATDVSINFIDHVELLRERRMQDKADAITATGQAYMEKMKEMMANYDIKIVANNKDIITGLPITP